jgi:hypothetical protein
MGLAACAPTQPPEPPPVAAVPTIERAAYAGSRQRLDFLTTLWPDCSYMGPSTYHFIVRPQHGVIDFKQAEEPPAYLQSSIYYKCNDHRVRGVMLYYTPNRGFDGADHFVMEWISPAGLLYRRQYEVVVK